MVVDEFADEEEIELTVDALVKFVKQEVEPIEDEFRSVLDDQRAMYDDQGRPVPEYKEARRRARMASAGAGYYSLFAPTDLGGGGQGSVLTLRAWEALYPEFGPGRPLLDDVLGKWNRGPSGIIRGFSERLRAEIAPRLLDGHDIFCFGMSEPDAGSDARAMTTRAERTPDGWRINGVKQWISDSPYSDHILLFAVTNEQARNTKRAGISAFFMPMDTPGLEIASVIQLFGEIGGIRGILTFDDVEVPADALVGDEDAGLALAIEGVSLGRMYNAGRGVGMARWALEQATDYAKSRKTFGHVIADYQAIQFMLADSAIEIYAGYTMALDCARRLDAGEKMAKQLAMVKAFTTDVSFNVLDRCMQIHGGMGFVNELRIQAGWHQARISRVADGSAEIMRRNIARAVMAGDLEL
jgi:acyl-CoA dehydrogenase